MRKSIFDAPVLAEVKSRLEKLNENTERKWGTLKVNQMLRHLVEGNKITSGDLHLDDRSSLMTRTMLRFFLLRAMVPSAKMREKSPPETFPEINIIKGNIPAGDFGAEKKNFEESLNKLLKVQKFPDRHPLIGKMNKANWGQQAYSHYHYHFTQFGV